MISDLLEVVSRLFQKTMFVNVKHLAHLLRQLTSNEGVDRQLGVVLMGRFLAVFLTIITMLLVFGTLFFYVTKISSAIVVTCLIAITLLAWRINRRGDPRRAAIVFAVLAWVVGTTTLYLGSASSISVLVLGTSVVVAVVLGGRSGLLIIFSYLAVWLLYMVLDAHGLSPTKRIISNPLMSWFHNVIGALLLLLPLPELVSRLRSAQMVAETASRNKLRALTLMSRHIHGPMNGIIGTTQILEMGELNAEQRELLAGLKSSAGELQTLLDRVLDYSSIDGGETRLRYEPFSWMDLLDRLRNRHAVAENTGQRLALTLDPALLPLAQGDAGRIFQLLDELLKNALVAAPSGMISVFVRPAAAGVLIEVVDDGPGIEAERLATLFEPFSNPSVGDGHGLGLPLAGALTRAMNGTIVIDSCNGETRVHVSLPLMSSYSVE